jgi:uncharacterized protein YaaN involved in tellurite resistance
MSIEALTKAQELATQIKRLRNACRTVADQYDEFGTIYDEALSELYDAEDAFWRTSEENASRAALATKENSNAV